MQATRTPCCRHPQIPAQGALIARPERRSFTSDEHQNMSLIPNRDGVMERGEPIAGPAGVEIAQDPHVHTSGERAAGPSDHGHARRAVRRQLDERVAHGSDEGRFEEVERRTIERAPDRGARPLKREWRPHYYRRIEASTVRAQE